MRFLVFALVLTQTSALLFGAEVTVVDPKGLPVENAQVAFLHSASRVYKAAKTDGDGKATVDVPEIDSTSVFCVHPQYAAFHKKSHMLKKPLRIQLKKPEGVGSAILTTGRGEVPGLSGLITLIVDQENRLHVYSSAITLGDGREQLVQARLGRPIQMSDSNGNRSDVRVVAVEGRAALVQFQKRPKSINVPNGKVLVTDVAGNPVSNAQVFFVNSARKTHRDGKTLEDGFVSIDDVTGDSVIVFCAHPEYRAVRQEGHIVDEPLHIELVAERQIGSLICDSTGHIPGLEGRLNPILDNLDRTYLYADNIALDGGQQQPLKFRVGRPIHAVDSRGAAFQLMVLDIIGRTSLIEFQPQ